MEKQYLQLNDLSCYRNSFELSNFLWDRIVLWEYFSRDTIGKQFINAIDSISANIAEGFGRYHKKDKIKFYYYSFGSVKESISWNDKALYIKLISEQDYQKSAKILEQLPKEIHQLIKFTNDRLKD